jgi:CRISPR-associated exonuclease Cas4
MPDPREMGETALRTLRLPDIAALRPFLVPELPVWASAEDGLIAGRADALAVRNGSIEVALDWKSDVDPAPSVRAGYVRQLRRYLSATGASRGALVFMSLGEVVWVTMNMLLRAKRSHSYLEVTADGKTGRSLRSHCVT